MQAPLSKSNIIIGKRVQNLYIRKYKCLKTSASVNHFSSVNLLDSCNKANVTNLWHKMLGHLPFYKMKFLSLTSTDCTSDLFDTCNICFQARQHKMAFSLSDTRSQQPFDLIHMDTWGPYKVQTYNGYK